MDEACGCTKRVVPGKFHSRGGGVIDSRAMLGSDVLRTNGKASILERASVGFT